MSDEIWETVWNKKLITSDYSLKYLDFMHSVETGLPPDSLILEAGCGTGQTLSLFSLRHETVGLDISKSALNLARKNCNNPVLASIFSMPFKDNTFDLVYNSGVIEHFQEPDNVEAIREMGRVTKANGKVIVIVPNSLCLWYRMAKFTAVVLKGFEFGYEEDYTPGRLRSAVGAAGLIPEGTFGLQVLPPLATNDRELLPEPYRKKMVELEKHFCHKENYAYAVGIIARKEI